MAIIGKFYATQKGLGAYLIDNPDPAKKLLQETARMTAGMRENYAWNRQEAAAISSQMSRNAQLEAQNRQDNWKLRQLYRDTVAEARHNQHQQIMANHKTRIENELQKSDLQSLLEFTATGAKQIQEIGEQRKKHAMLEWQMFNDDYGVSSKEVDAVNAISAHEWKRKKETTQIYRDLKDRGYPTHLIDRLRGVSGYDALAIKNITAVNLAKTWGTEYKRHWDTEFTLNDQTDTIRDAYMSGDPARLKQALRAIDKQIIEDYGPSFPAMRIFHTSGARKIKEQFRLEILRKQETVASRNADEKYKGELKNLIKNAVNQRAPASVGQNKIAVDGVNPLQGIIDVIENELGDNPTRLRKQQVRDEIGGLVTELIGEGEFNHVLEYFDDEDLKTITIDMGAAGKMNLLQGMRKNATEWQKAAAKQENVMNAQALLDTAKKRVEGNRMYSDYARVLSESDPSPEHLEKMINAASRHPFGDRAKQLVVKRLIDNAEIVNDRDGSLAVNNALLGYKRVDLDDYGLSKEARAVLKERVDKHNILAPTDADEATLIEEVEGALESVIPSKSTMSRGFTRGAAEAAGYQHVAAGYFEARNQGKSHSEALDVARGRMNDLIDPKGKWRKTLVEGSGYEFEEFLIGKSNQVVMDYPEIKAQLTRNPDIIYTNNLILDDDLREISAKSNNGLMPQLPPQSIMLETLSGVDAVDVVNAQLQRLKNQEIAQLGSSSIQLLSKEYVAEVKKATGLLHPRLRKWVNSDVATETVVNRAAIEQGNPPIYQGKSYKTAATILSQNTGSHDFIVDVESGFRGNSRNYPWPQGAQLVLREMTPKQADGLSKDKQFLLGMHQLPGGALSELAVEAGLDPRVDKLTKANQARLFNIYFKKFGPSVYPNFEELSERDKIVLNDIWELTKAKELDKEKGLKNTALMRSEAVDAAYQYGIITGNIDDPNKVQLGGLWWH